MYFIPFRTGDFCSYNQGVQYTLLMAVYALALQFALVRKKSQKSSMRSI